MTDHIVLKPVEQEEITSSGLVIPDTAKEQPQHGTVVAVGPPRSAGPRVDSAPRLVVGATAATQVRIRPVWHTRESESWVNGTLVTIPAPGGGTGELRRYDAIAIDVGSEHSSTRRSHPRAHSASSDHRSFRILSRVSEVRLLSGTPARRRRGFT